MVRSTPLHLLVRGAQRAKKVPTFHTTLTTFQLFSDKLFLSTWINRKTYMKINIQTIIWVRDQPRIINDLVPPNPKNCHFLNFKKWCFSSFRAISMGSGLHFWCLRRAAAQKQWLIHGAKHSPPSLGSEAPEGPKSRFQHFILHWQLFIYFLMNFS